MCFIVVGTLHIMLGKGSGKRIVGQYFTENDLVARF